MKYAHPPMNPTPKPHDPRIAPLAAALHRTAVHNHNVGEGPLRAICFEAASHKDRAAAILAALPEGWCGHDTNVANALGYREGYRDAAMRRDAELARLREDLRVANTQLDNWVEFAAAKNAELIRLRAIEEAARAAQGLDHPNSLPGSVDHGSRSYPCRCAVHEDLRAALEAE